MNKTGLIYGKEKLREYLDVSEYIMKKFIAMGLPVLIENGTYIAHKDNIEDWVRHITRKKVESQKKIVKQNLRQEPVKN